MKNYIVIIVFKQGTYEFEISATTKSQALNKAITILANHLKITKAEIKKYTKHKFNKSIKRVVDF